MDVPALTQVFCAATIQGTNGSLSVPSAPKLRSYPQELSSGNRIELVYWFNRAISAKHSPRYIALQQTTLSILWARSDYVVSGD
jgi:hypothetical protein